MNKIWKLSLIRFSIFQVLLLIIITLVFIINGITSKQTQARLITASIRNNVLIGDRRTVVDSLSILKNNFNYIVVNDRGESIIEVGNPELIHNSLSLSYIENILVGPMADSKVASIQYYFSVVEFLKNSFKVWLIFIISSLPFLTLEKNRLLAKHNESIRWKEAEMKKIISEQVSHDIRSPLAVMQEILWQAEHLGKFDITTMKTVTQRIEDIANDLILENQKIIPQVSIINSSANVIEEIRKIIIEKKYQFKNKEKINLTFNHPEEDILIRINKLEFYRLISNLINNSFEAIDLVGNIDITLSSQNDKVQIIIKDDGKGIPENIINRIGERGLTYNKNEKKIGHGLGLYHAKKNILKFDGTFEIRSKISKGTEVIINLPYLNDSLKTQVYDYVYIDDDEMLRMLWANTAKKKSKSLLILDSIEDFESYLLNLNKEYTKIYVDYELGETKLKGLDFAIKLNDLGYKHIYIATGYPAAKFEMYPWLNHWGKKCPI